MFTPIRVTVLAIIVGVGLAYVFFAHGDYAAVEPTPDSMPAPASAPSLVIRDDVVGPGKAAQTGDTVSVLYTGKLADGTVFDSTSNRNNQPFSFVLGAGKVIKGWEEGLVGMKVGGTRTLTIPPDMAYGDVGHGDVIPPNATLTFEVKLIEAR